MSSAGVCRVTLIGNIGREPTTRYTPQGVMFLSFNLGTTRHFKNTAGEMQEKTAWFRVTAWRGLAETLNTLVEMGALVTGRQVYVSGNLEPREYYDDSRGQNMTSLDVIADDVQLLGPKMDGMRSGTTAADGTFSFNP